MRHAAFALALSATVWFCGACAPSSTGADGGDADGGPTPDQTDTDGLDGDAPRPGAAPAYGVFQLYGDEYVRFRQLMGQSLPDYWAFVDTHVARLQASSTRTNTLLIWQIVEPALGGGFQWDNELQTDAVIKAAYAPAAGKQMDLLLVIEPSRGARGDPPYPTGLEAEYQAFVRAVVERYDGDGVDDVDDHVRVKHWQVMNEPFWALSQGVLTPRQYADLVVLTEQAIHQADPEAKIVLGDVGQAISEIAPLLASARFDAVDRHFWSAQNALSPDIPSVRQLLDANNHAGAEIWMCEFGTWRNSPQNQPVHTAGWFAGWSATVPRA